MNAKSGNEKNFSNKRVISKVAAKKAEDVTIKVEPSNIKWTEEMEDALLLSYKKHYDQSGNQDSDKSLKPKCWYLFRI